MSTTVIRTALGALFIHGAVALSSQASAQCCQALIDAGLESRVSFPGSDTYQDRLSSYWSVSAALESWCVVLPQVAEDASVALQALVKSDCHFGIRSGGHGASAGSNSVADGVTIDFGYMNKTSYDADAKIVSIQPGSHWQQVYDHLAPLGVTVTGGRAGSVGVGGFLTGGGISFHAASHGLACDNVVNWEVVLADGTITNANATHNPDLWTALKGGSGNLALVTRIDLFAIEFPNPAEPVVWGGALVYAPSAAPLAAEAMVDFIENIDNDKNSSSMILLGNMPSLGGPAESLVIFAVNTLGNSTSAPPAFDRYLAVPGLVADTTGLYKMGDLTYAIGENQPPNFRDTWLTSTFNPDARVITFALERHGALKAKLAAALPPTVEFNTFALLQPLSRALVTNGLARGGPNVVGLAENVQRHGDGALLLVAFFVPVSEHAVEAERLARPIMRAYVDAVDAYAAELGVAWGWKYLNYADLEQAPMGFFGESALTTLREVAKKFDPEGVFQRLRATGHKIPVGGGTEDEEDRTFLHRTEL